MWSNLLRFGHLRNETTTLGEKRLLSPGQYCVTHTTPKKWPFVAKFKCRVPFIIPKGCSKFKNPNRWKPLFLFMQHVNKRLCPVRCGSGWVGSIDYWWFSGRVCVLLGFGKWVCLGTGTVFRPICDGSKLSHEIPSNLTEDDFHRKLFSSRAVEQMGFKQSYALGIVLIEQNARWVSIYKFTGIAGKYNHELNWEALGCTKRMKSCLFTLI